MDVDMTSESEGAWVASGAEPAASSGGGPAGSSGGEAPGDGEAAGPSGGGEAGPSGSGGTFQRGRGGRYKGESRRKRKNKCYTSTGEVLAKKMKTAVAGGSDQKMLESCNSGVDGSIAELLDGMTVHVLGEDNNEAARRSKFDHRTVAWWTSSNWHQDRKGADEHEDGNGMASSSSRQNVQSLSSQGTINNNVPVSLMFDRPTGPVMFNREDAAAAARSSVQYSDEPLGPDDGWRSNHLTIKVRHGQIARELYKTARLEKRMRARRQRKQRRHAVSDSDIDVKQAQEEFEELIASKREKEPVVSSDTSDSSYSSLYNSITESSSSDSCTDITD